MQKYWFPSPELVSYSTCTRDETLILQPFTQLCRFWVVDSRFVGRTNGCVHVRYSPRTPTGTAGVVGVQQRLVMAEEGKKVIETVALA